ncbi:protein toll [Caerostris extrusa]|uniref:Protein toll n=1 Tax=Caerostris extrusa TaxID=172846 RepID=A0AAV4VH84_CAEEX|nr:protein toll [Caerostris extrusa]
MKTCAPLLTMVPLQLHHLPAAPASCRCSCTNNRFMSVDCSSSQLTHLPPLFSPANASYTEEENSTVLVIFLPRANSNIPFVIEDEIEGVNLSNNTLQSMEEARLPNRTKLLFLDHNHIRKPPIHLLESLEGLKEVTLSTNPWACDCTALDFMKWVVSKSDLVLDVNETRCGPDMPKSPGLADRAIWLLTDADLCPGNIGLYISLAFGILSKPDDDSDSEETGLKFILSSQVFFLVVAGVKIAWTRYELNVKVWLYSHGVSWVKEKDIDRDKIFDAFISFSHKDEGFVIPEIIGGIEEKDPSIRLCLHYKHFLPGEFYPCEHHEGRGMLQENSPRALSVRLSLSHLKPRIFWKVSGAFLEFNAAHVQALKDHVHRIVIIKLADLPKDEELPKEIQLYLSSTTYLTWGRSTSGTTCCTYSRGRSPSQNPSSKMRTDFLFSWETPQPESFFPRLRKCSFLEANRSSSSSAFNFQTIWMAHKLFHRLSIKL